MLDVRVDVLESCKWFIHTRVSWNDGFLIGFKIWCCAPNSYQNKTKLWNILIDILSVVEGPWLVVGDFKKNLHDEEKSGGNRRDRRQTLAFQNMIS